VARPKNCRRVGALPGSEYFKPRGIPLLMLEEITLTVDEFEAIRLADLEKLYQEEAAAKMKVSRATFGRIIDSAHKKVAEVLVHGKALKIEGGDFEVPSGRKFACSDCQHNWGVSYRTGRPGNCPLCKGSNIHRIGEGSGTRSGCPVGGGIGCRKMQGKKKEGEKSGFENKPIRSVGSDEPIK
jgi:uncharacterized protein